MANALRLQRAEGLSQRHPDTHERSLVTLSSHLRRDMVWVATQPATTLAKRASVPRNSSISPKQMRISHNHTITRTASMAHQQPKRRIVERFFIRAHTKRISQVRRELYAAQGQTCSLCAYGSRGLPLNFLCNPGLCNWRACGSERRPILLPGKAVTGGILWLR